MYKQRYLVALIAASLAALLVAVAISAFTASGTVVLPSGGGFGGARVTIYNYNTGASGATYANSSGVYTFTGLDSTNRYSLGATGCWLHQNYASVGNTYYGSGSLPTIHMTALGTYC